MQPFVVLVPVKPPAVGKSRLGDLPDDVRRAMATAFAHDTAAAAWAADRVAAVMVVTDDHRLAADFREAGLAVLPDGVAGDLNGTLVQAALEADRRWPGAAVAALCADLPALRPEELDEALGQVPDGGSALVADSAGTGTTMYAAWSATAFHPRFGPGSREAHAADGAHEVTGELPSLRQDVDEAADLGRVLLLGVGPRTAAVLGRG